MPIFGVVNQKGGVGKTTTTVNLAAALASRGRRVLVVDGDPQGNATTGLGWERATDKVTLFDLISDAVNQPDTVDVREAIYEAGPNVHLIPSTIELAGAEPILLGAVGKEQILAELLSTVSDLFDFVLIDSPPSLGLLTVNILASADSVLIPMQCEYYALEGLSQLLRSISLVSRRINPKLEVGRVVLTMYDPRNRLTQQVEADVRDYFGPKVCQTVIPRNVRLSEAPSFGEPAVLRFPSSKGAEAYVTLADEILGVATEVNR